MRRVLPVLLIAVSTARGGELEDLIARLGDDDPAVRESATEALAVRGEAAGAALRAAAADSPDPEIRSRAIRLLRILQWSRILPESFRTAHPSAARELAQGTEEERAGWVKRLLSTCADAAAPALLLSLPGASPGFRRSLLLELSRKGSTLAAHRAPELLDPLILVLDDEDPALRGLALLVAATWATPAGEDEFARAVRTRLFPAVRARLSDPDVVARAAAAQALGAIGDREALAGLIATLSDAAGSVRVQAAGALGKLGDARAVVPLLQALGDPGADVVRASARALSLLNARDAADPLRTALRRADLPPSVRESLLESLEGVDRGGAAAAEEFLQDPNTSLRATAWRLLLSRDLGRVETAVRDEDAEVRLVAARALRRGDRSHLPLLAALLDDAEVARVRESGLDDGPSMEVRAGAVEALEAVAGETLAGSDVEERATAWKAWFGRRDR